MFVRKRTTIRDIANEAGVDKSTVSLVLNRKPLADRIAEKTKERILSIAKKLDYVPSFTAKSLASGKTDTIGIILSNIANPYVSELAEAAIKLAAKRNRQLLISTTNQEYQKELDCLNYLMQRNVDGVIFMSSVLADKPEICKKIIKRRYPIVMFNAKAQIDGISSLKSDYVQGMNDAVELLFKNGHRKIALVSHEDSDSCKNVEFEKACKKFDIAKNIIPDTDMTALAKKIGGDKKIPKALIVSADSKAMRLISGLSQNGIRVPDDLDIISIDGTKWGSFFCPPLTSIKQDVEKMLEKAIELIVDNPEETQNLSFPTKLIIRKSVKLI